MNEDQIDVNTETTDASSAENQPEMSQDTQVDQPVETEDKKVSDSVPYDRFAEVNSINKTLKEEQEKMRQELEAIKASQSQPQTPQTPQDIAQKQQEQLVRDQLKNMGFLDQEEVNKKLQQIEEDRALDSKLQNLELKYSGKDGMPKFKRSEILEYAHKNQIGDIEGAYKLKYQAEIIDNAIKAAQGKSKPVKSESSDGSGSQNAGTTDGDLITAAKKGDKSSLLSFIKRQM